MILIVILCVRLAFTNCKKYAQKNTVNKRKPGFSLGFLRKPMFSIKKPGFSQKPGFSEEEKTYVFPENLGFLRKPVFFLRKPGFSVENLGFSRKPELSQKT